MGLETRTGGAGWTIICTLPYQLSAHVSLLNRIRSAQIATGRTAWLRRDRSQFLSCLRYGVVMRLTLHTDFALRVLIQVELNDGDLTTINDIVQSFGISKPHLMKVVNYLVS